MRHYLEHSSEAKEPRIIVSKTGSFLALRRPRVYKLDFSVQGFAKLPSFAALSEFFQY